MGNKAAAAVAPEAFQLVSGPTKTEIVYEKDENYRKMKVSACQLLDFLSQHDTKIRLSNCDSFHLFPLIITDLTGF